MLTVDKISKDEIYSLFNDYHNGSEEAREKLIIYNYPLVIHEVYKKFKTVNYDKDDIIEYGIIGLIKGIDTFNTNKGTSFSSYAVKCIDNEIYQFLRQIKKNEIVKSYEETFYDNEGFPKKNMKKFVVFEEDGYEKIINNEIYKIIRKIVCFLPLEERKIIILYFGFFGCNPLEQKEIAKLLNMSQAGVSRSIKKSLNTIARKLEKIEAIEKGSNKHKISCR